MNNLMVLDSINDYLESANLNDPWAMAVLVVIVMVGVALLGHKYGANGSALFIINAIIFIIAVLVGFLPIWSLLALIMVVILYGTMILNSGGG